MSEMKIETEEGGPFKAHGIAVRNADYHYAEDGAPMTWKFGDLVHDPAAAGADDPVSLCRCGHSDDKPFCDGSHREVDWDGADAELPDRPFMERAEAQGASADGYEMLDDTPLCTHAGLCATAKESVWEMMPATDDPEVRGQAIRMVEKCPSGRLVNVVDGAAMEPSLPTEVNVVPGGPLWVTGGVTVTNAAGEQLETRNRMTLCRCGASGNKPLCDGSHKDIAFQGIE